MTSQAITRADVVAEARTWLATPFHHQARLKGVGVDCAGLCIGVARALGLIDPAWDVHGYDRNPDGRTLMAACLEQMDPTDQADMQPGDVLMVRFDTHPQHLGLLGDYRHGGLSIIHASGNEGRVIETRLMFSSAMLFVAAFRLRGLVAGASAKVSAEVIS